MSGDHKRQGQKVPKGDAKGRRNSSFFIPNNSWDFGASFVRHSPFFSKANHHRKYKKNLPKAKDFFTWKDWQAGRKPMHRIDRTSSLYKWWNVYGSHRRPLLKYKLTLEKIQDAVVVMSRTLDLGSIKSKSVRSNERYKSVIVMKSSLPP